MRKANVTIWVMLVVLVATSVGSADLTDGLVAYYPFNGDANDESGNGNHGTEHGGPSYVGGVCGEAISLDGIDDYASFPSDITISEDFTIACEINFADLSFTADQHIIWKHQLHSNTDGGWTIQVKPDSRFDFGYYANGINHIVTEPLDMYANTWHHLAMTFDDNDNSYNIYLDAVVVEYGTRDIVITENSRPMYIAAGYSGLGPMENSPFSIDEIRIYNRALSACQIRKLGRCRGIIYVDVDASGANDGSSWEDAFNYLQDALAVAKCGNEIWVAEGIYRSDEDSLHPDGTGDRTATFQLINGVALKGGYAGFGESDLNKRDIELYETILSGDLNGDDVDVNDPFDLSTEPTRSENSYHIFYHPTGTNLDSTAILDGFTITAGNAWGTGVHSHGGGICNYTSDPTITNCTFTNNSAGCGGGINNSDSSDPTVANCSFSNCYAQDGAGINNTRSSPMVTNCTFNGNSANYGALHNCEGDPAITNCVFNNNVSNISGGAIYNHDSDPDISNCTLSANSGQYGGGIYNESNSDPKVSNCILWGNLAPNGPQIYNDGSSFATVTYSDVQGGWAGNIDIDPLFVDPGSGNYRLSAGSDCIDAGDNAAVPPGVTTDLDSNPRIVDGDRDGDAVVDMGAYENMVVFVETCCAVNVGMTSATLCGRIIYDGGEACRYRFRYCKEGEADSFTPWSSDSKTAGESFSQDISGLSPGSHYYFFAQIRNSGGEDAGGLKSLTTLDSLLQLEAPNGGNTILAGGRCLICWKADPALGDRDVLVEYSTDNSSSWNTIDTVAIGDAWRSYIGGHYSWYPPAVSSDECLVRVSDTSDPSIFDVSDRRLSIVAQTVPDVVGQGQADAESAITSAGLVVGTITYIYDNVAAAGEVMGQNPAAGTPVLAGSAVDLVISAGPFAAGPPAVTSEYAVNIGASSATVRGVITDDGGGCCQYRFWYHEEGGDHYDVTPWSSEFKTAGESFSQDIDGLTPGTKYYFWAQAKNSAGESDRWAPSKSFATLEGLLQLQTPNGGTFSAGSRCLICWKADAAVSDVLVEYSTDNGGSWSVIETVPNGDAWRSYKGGYYSWYPPAVSSDECLVRISDTSDASVFDVSENTFSIVP